MSRVALLVRPAVRRDAPAALLRPVVARLRVALRALALGRAEVSLVITDDAEIRELNRVWRRIDRATDVLSFPLLELGDESDAAARDAALGDIVIALPTARRRARRGLGRELDHLVVHGLCHLLGHDHKRPAQARRMVALERRLRRLPLAARERILAARR